MAKSSEWISDEFIELVSSSDSISGLETSLELPTNSSQSQNSDNYFLENGLGHHDYEDNSLIGKLKFLQDMANKKLISETKLAQLKQAVTEANNAYVVYKTSETLVQAYNKAKTSLPVNIQAKLNKIENEHKVPKLAAMRSKDGKVYNLFGLEDVDMRTTDVSLSSDEKSIVKSRVLHVVKEKIKQSKKEKQTLKDTFGKHCVKVTSRDSVLSEERDELIKEFRALGEGLEQICRLLEVNTQLLRDLTQPDLQKSQKEVQLSQHTQILEKAKYLHNKISALKLKMQQRLFKDGVYTKAVDKLGEELQISLHEAQEELKRLQKILNSYEEKEKSSKSYKKMIEKFRHVKRQLQQKEQTLSMLSG
ncbi:hypothetical protein J6590_068954 [Homalodisca vitripennis]|nr:hypothetical protein J6590_068954 [Homalodisca vitripennis]